jgi:hypothetical protein
VLSLSHGVMTLCATGTADAFVQLCAQTLLLLFERTQKRHYLVDACLVLQFGLQVCCASAWQTL